MKISCDEEEVFCLTETQKNVIRNDIHEDVFEDDMKRRLHWVLNHKYERCFQRLKAEWEPKLKQRYSMLPSNDEDFCNLIFSQSDYKCRKTRDQEAEQLLARK